MTAFRLAEAVPVLRRTPDVVSALLQGLPEAWLRATDGPGTWSPFDVVGHMIHGEKTDWIPRAQHLLAHGEAVPFPVFDREAMFEASQGKGIDQLLDEFAHLRSASLDQLDALHLSEADLSRTGRHPELGVVTLSQHFATWVAHDLGHTDQIVRTMGRRYTDAVGPWRKYLSMLNPPPAPVR